MDSQGHVATAQHNYGFELIHTVSAHDGTQVCEYKSKTTGLTVVFAPVGGPYIRASLVFPTEYCDDNGLPSAVESLISMGRKQHPSMLDALSKINLTTRTMGLTDTDYTAFELTCVESNGFLNLLPVYMDQILNPAFTKEAFLTEIHHIDGEGKDGGSLYELAVKLLSLSSCYLSYQILGKAMYPSNSGYAYQNNGNPASIREITLEQIKQYHKQYYQVANLTVNIIGNIDHRSVFQALTQFDKMSTEGVIKRPWQTPIPPLSETKSLVHHYSENEECNEGCAFVGWRGPTVCDQYTFIAVKMFLNYLTDSPDGKLFKEFVEIPDRCASKVYFTDYQNSETCFYLFFDDVPVDKLPKMPETIFMSLKNCIDNFDDSDMDILEIAIQSEKFLYLSVHNEYPHNMVEFRLAEYAVHGSTAQDLEAKVNPFKHYNELLNEPKTFWINLARKYLLENNHVALQCYPSKSVYEENQRNEEERVKNQIETLGAEVLKEHGAILQEAKIGQKKAAEVLNNSIGKVEPGSLHFFKLTRYSSDSSNQRIDLSNTSVFTYFDDIEEADGVVSIFALLDSSKVPAENRICLNLLLQTLFKSSMRRNGSLLPTKNVLRELKRSLITSKTCFGLNPELELFQCGKYSNTLMVMIQVEADKYDVGIGWMRDILFNLEFALEDVKIVADGMLKEITNRTSSGAEITRHSLHNLIYIKDCNIVQNELLLQETFLTTVTQQTINMMSTTWKHLTDPKNITLHIVGSLNSIREPERALNDFLPEHIKPLKTNKYRPQVVSDENFFSDTATNCAIIGMEKDHITASYFISSVESINSHDNPDLPLLLLYLEYLTASKGPINKPSKRVTTYMKLEPHRGLLSFKFNNARDVFKSYTMIKEKTLDQIRNRRWNNDWLNIAKKTVAGGFISKEIAVYDVTRLAVQSYFQKVDYTHNRTMLHKVLSATTSDLDEVGPKYLPELFNPNRAKIAIITVPSKTQEIADSFRSLNFNVEIF